MLIASWNVNSVRARLPIILEWLSENSPDVVLLQETKVQDHQFPEESFWDAGYQLALWGQKTFAGVAIASKFPIEDVHRGLSQELGGEARYIEAFTEGVRVASVYVPNGQGFDSPRYAYKREFLYALRKHLKPMIDADEPVAVGGDYNIATWDRDASSGWNGDLMCSQEERSWMRAAIYDGWWDPFDAISGGDGKNQFTWWDYRGGAFDADDGLRIDTFLLSPRAMDRLLRCGVEEKWRRCQKTSDHAPLWVELKLD